MIHSLNETLKESVLNSCMRIASSRQSQIIAACLYGPRACGYSEEESDANVLLVLRGFRLGAMGYREPLNDIDALILAVDQGAFEKDIDGGWLGEFAADKLMVPYEPLSNSEYLWRQEVRVKKRVVWELLENIVLEFPELSHELLIDNEYFMYETMMRRARLFPFITYRFLNILRSDLRERNVKLMMNGYVKALEELAEENWIAFANGRIKITRKFIGFVKSRKIRIPLFLKSVQRAATLHVLSILPKMMSPLAHEEQIFIKTYGEVADEDLASQLEDPKKYLLMPTPLSLVPLSDKTTIEDFVRKSVPSERIAEIKIEEIGGVLNTAYVLTFRRDHEKQRIVVKKFKDWLGFKWFPLALWALGTKSFAVLGQSRLEREYALNQFLHGQGSPVPKVLYVSPQERLIFKEFIEGENLTDIIKRLIINKEKAMAEVAVVREVGRKIAEAHRLGVALGDCKPENIIVTANGKPYFVDLEQASRDGNQAWDVAEFLYYSGHYVSPIAPANAAELIAKEFIQGYLEAGGHKETVRKAGSPRYTKVFSIFTPPQVILAISSLCKKTGELESSKQTLAH